MVEAEGDIKSDEYYRMFGGLLGHPFPTVTEEATSKGADQFLASVFGEGDPVDLGTICRVEQLMPGAEILSKIIASSMDMVSVGIEADTVMSKPLTEEGRRKFIDVGTTRIHEALDFAIHEGIPLNEGLVQQARRRLEVNTELIT